MTQSFNGSMTQFFAERFSSLDAPRGRGHDSPHKMESVKYLRKVPELPDYVLRLTLCYVREILRAPR
jgi:hypothetical protein